MLKVNLIIIFINLLFSQKIAFLKNYGKNNLNINYSNSIKKNKINKNKKR